MLTYSLILQNYSKCVTEQEIVEIEKKELTAIDTGGKVLRKVILGFIESCTVVARNESKI